MSKIYRHLSTGNLYEKLHDSKIVDTKQLVVIYRSIKTGEIWVRNTEIFNQRFERVNNDSHAV